MNLVFQLKEVSALWQVLLLGRSDPGGSNIQANDYQLDGQ